jgi:hypothetical protein
MRAAIPALWNKSVSGTRTATALVWLTKAIASGP